MSTRKVWVRSNAAATAAAAGGGATQAVSTSATDANDDENEQVGWVPAVVVTNGRDEDSSADQLSVHLETWEALNKKRPGANAGADDSDDSDSDFGNDQDDGAIDEDAVLHVAAADVVERNAWDEPPADLVQLVHLHEPAILQALCERFWTSMIYTWCGPILLALNPFERLPLYQPSVLESYRKASALPSSAEAEDGGNQPHVYAVAADAYACLVDKSGREGGDQDQSILISGESGAGKTESTKIVMQYLATVARRPREDGVSVEELHVSEYLGGTEGNSSPKASHVEPETATTEHYSIEQQVLESNPILEAFGNARTIRNDNSSRFGKFIQIQFDAEGFLVGASIATYLLEKVRITQQGEGERGYHVFYQMLYGGSGEEKASWHLSASDEPEDFTFLNAGGCYDRRDGVSDAEQLAVTKRSMAIMGLRDEERIDVLKVVAIVLHLGNIIFVDAKGGDQDAPGSTVDSSDEQSEKALEALVALLGLDREVIIKALCMRNVNAGGETFEVPLKPSDAVDSRDALAKSLYSRTFDWIVGRVNECIRHRTKVKRFVGVLDIFGFEIFKHNSFEQLCINYANERLQQQFNDFVFKHEQSIYAKEKINWSFIDFPSNAATVELIDGGIGASSGKEDAGSMGILAVLDDECRLPKGNDQSFVRKLYDKCASREQFDASKPQQVRGEFVVHHYAGAVTYDSAGFCDKNRDALRQEVVDLLKGSAFGFVSARFSVSANEGGSPSKGKRGNGSSSSSSSSASASQRRSALSLASVSAEFKRQLNSLIETIEATAPHYIRCIKPNDAAKAKLMHRGRVVGQLRCGGVLEAVRVARAGFPIRMPHRTFVERYGRLVGPAALKVLFHTSPVNATRSRKILEEIPKVGDFDRSASRQLGKDIVSLLRAQQQQQPQEGCDEEEDGQSNTKGSDGSDDVEALTQIGRTKVFMRKQGHDVLERWRARWHKRAMALVVAAVRARAGRLKYQRQRASALRIQSVVRMKLARNKLQHLRRERASLKIQTWMRMKFYRMAYSQIRNATIAIQAASRGRKGRAEAHVLRVERARLRLQSWARGVKYLRLLRRERRAAITLQCAVRGRQARDAVRAARRGAKDLGNVLKERDALRAQVQALKQQLAVGGRDSETPASDATTGDIRGVVEGQSPERQARAVAVLAAASVTVRMWFYMKDVMKTVERKRLDLAQQAAAQQPIVDTIASAPSLPLQSAPSALADGSPRKSSEALGLETSPPPQQQHLLTGLGPGSVSDADWYARTFGEELEELGRANQGVVAADDVGDGAGGAGAKDAARNAKDAADIADGTTSSDELRRIEEELKQKRLSIEAKRAKLESEAPSHATATETETGGSESPDAKLGDFEERLAELVETLHTKENEVIEVKNFLAQQTSLKNKAEIRQSELELELNATKEGRVKLEADLAAAAKTREDLEARVAELERERDANREVARSAAVIDLETELRSAHQDADGLREELAQAKQETERLIREGELKAMSLDDYRSSSAAKMKLLETQLSEVKRSKAKTTSMLQARILIDRRSRRTAQHVISVWAAAVRESKSLRMRAAFAQRLLERRRLQRAFDKLAAAGSQEQFEEAVVSKALARREHRLLYKSFQGWADETRRGVHAERVDAALAGRDAQLLCMRVFRAWHTWATLRLEEEVQFNRLTEVFHGHRLRRHFVAWREAHVHERRLAKLEDLYKRHMKELKLRNILHAWSRATRAATAYRPEMSRMVTAREAEDGSPMRKERGDADLLRLMGRLVKDDETFSRLTPVLARAADRMQYRSSSGEDLLDDDVLGGYLPRSPQIEQLQSDDEDEDDYDDDDNESEDAMASDSFHSKSRARGRRGSYKSRRSSQRKLNGTSDVFRTTEYVEEAGRSRRDSAGMMDRKTQSMRGPRLVREGEDSRPFAPGNDGKNVLEGDDASSPSRRSADIDGENSVHLFRSSSSPLLIGDEHAGEGKGKEMASALTLDMVGVRRVKEDGTLEFDDGASPVASIDTVMQTARQLNMPPLILAALHGNLDVVERLLKEGMDPNVDYSGKHRTALHAAIQSFKWSESGVERMVDLLLEHGANVHAKNSHGNTPLMEAVLKGDEALSLTKALIRHGAIRGTNAKDGDSTEGANEFGQTPLHAAVRLGATKTMYELLNNGANLTRGDSQGQTALHHAARICNVSMIHNLLGYSETRAGELQIEANKERTANGVNGVDRHGEAKGGKGLRNLTDNNGNTALHLVCSSTSSSEMWKAIFVLLENEFDPNLKNRAGQTPLCILCSNKSSTKKALKMFKRPNVRFHEQDRLGNTALHIACHLDSREIACRLVRMGAPLFIPNDHKETPMDLVPQGFAVQLLRAIKYPPEEELMRKFHRDIKKCMTCRNTFSFFRDQHHCRHCGRVCCTKCTSHKYPIAKFNAESSVTVCDHCWSVLTMPMSPVDAEMDAALADEGEELPSTALVG
ncbi:Myosin-6 [Hondaea fermentalgiana]|uniref:Myosin-6 n=1 Tax=Hondaea fermentalgiana TaxID=2315210 RepID=A0A2R5GPK4_9STRA|nr:Myosin-6 [Hondaea fermentalgiana]|eukprot:GBG31708.1 Myosin-6 [Hondaea fermentalgiana]